MTSSLMQGLARVPDLATRWTMLAPHLTAAAQPIHPPVRRLDAGVPGLSSSARLLPGPACPPLP
jgi:hypothetical protein